MLAIYQALLYQPILNLSVGLYDVLFHDFGLAIVALVVLVRGALWPLTHRSLQNQKAMMELQPKIKATQEKFKDDPKRLREEMGRLMKEENVNYAGALGCLPMLMQTPIDRKSVV